MAHLVEEMLHRTDAKRMQCEAPFLTQFKSEETMLIVQQAAGWMVYKSNTDENTYEMDPVVMTVVSPVSQSTI